MPGTECKLLLSENNDSALYVPLEDFKSNDDEILSFMRSKLHSNEPYVIQPRESSFKVKHN